MAGLSLTNLQIVREALAVAGFSRDPAAMDDATEGDIREIVRAGLRRFYFPVENGYSYHWNFLDRYHSIPALAKYSTGTVAVSGGTVTLTGGTWPADVVDYFVVVSGNILFVTERTSDTVIQVSNDQLTVAAGATYEASRFRYSLPADFSEWREGPVYMNGGTGTTRNRRLAGSSEAELRLRYAVGATGDDTTHYAITAASDGTFHILFWPVPIPNAFIQGTYQIIPDDSLEADLRTVGDTPVTQVPPKYGEALMECVLAAAEAYSDDNQGVHEIRAQTALSAAIAHDRATKGPEDFSQHLGRRTARRSNVLNIDFTSQL